MSWPIVAIGELGKIVTGKTPSTKDERNFGGAIPFVTPAELDADEPITMTPRTLTEKGAIKMKVLPADSVLVCCIGSLGKVGIAGSPLATNQQINAITFDATKVFPRYGYYAAKRLKGELENIAPATTVKIVSKSRFTELKIPLPPLEEQRRIAGILDAADALRRRRREALALLDTLPGAIFAEMFGDRLYGPDRATDTVPLSEVAHIQSGITKGRRLKPGEKTEETPYLAVANVQDKRLDLSNVKMIEATENERERYALVVGDLLLTEGGDPDKLGRGTVWGDEIPGAIHQNHIFRVRVTDETVQPIFLSHLLSSPFGRGYFLRMAKQTTGIASINKTQLSGFPAILPNEGEQIEFVRRLKSYQDQKEQYISHHGEVESLFSSLQSRAFAGEL